jgi:hypothetical protein
MFMIRFTIDPDAKIDNPATAKPTDASTPASLVEEKQKAPAKSRKPASKRPADQDDEKTLL